MVAVQIHTWDMGEAASRLIAIAAVHSESVHDTALLVIKRELRPDPTVGAERELAAPEPTKRSSPKLCRGDGSGAGIRGRWG